MTGIAPRPCLGVNDRRCGARVTGSSRCHHCQAEWESTREQARAGSRRVHEPWRRLYRASQWQRARAARLVMDEGRCVDCGSTKGTSVDHTIPLRELWGKHGGFTPSFIAAACDLSRLRTRCASCHGTVEAQRRRTP